MTFLSYKGFFCAIVLAVWALYCSGQDKLIFINGDTLSGRALKVSTGKLTFSEEGLEREISTIFVHKMLLRSGKETKFNDIHASLDFGKHFSVMAFSSEAISDANLLFPNAKKNTFTIKHLTTSYTAPQEPFLKATLGSAEHADPYLRDFVTLGLGCNAFLAFVDSRPGAIHYTFYSNAVSADKVREQVLNRSYKLVDSRAVGDLLELADSGLKPFTMEFKEGGVCNFDQDGKLTVLEYQISDNGEITFRDPKKRTKGTTYSVVFVDSKTMRYTQFSSTHKMVTRTVELIQ